MKRLIQKGWTDRKLLNSALYLGWIILAVLNVLDVWSTLSLLHSHRVVAEEANPFVRFLIDHSLFVPFKILIVGTIGYFCLKTKKPRKLAILIWIIIPIYVFVVTHNISYM